MTLGVAGKGVASSSVLFFASCPLGLPTTHQVLPSQGSLECRQLSLLSASYWPAPIFPSLDEWDSKDILKSIPGSWFCKHAGTTSSSQPACELETCPIFLCPASLLLSLRVPWTEVSRARKSLRDHQASPSIDGDTFIFTLVCLWGDGGREGMSCLDQHEPPGPCWPAVPLGCLSSFCPRWTAPTPTLHWALAFFFFKHVATLIVYWAVFINIPKRVS